MLVPTSERRASTMEARNIREDDSVRPDARDWTNDEVRARWSSSRGRIRSSSSRHRTRGEHDARPDGAMSRPRRAHRDPGHRQLLAASAPRADRAPQDRDAGVASREVRGLVQAGEEAAQTRRADSRAPAEAQPPAAESEDPQPHCDRSPSPATVMRIEALLRGHWPRPVPVDAPDTLIGASPHPRGRAKTSPPRWCRSAVVRVRGPSRLAGVSRDLSVLRTRCSPCRRPARGRIAHPATQRPNGPSSPPAAHAGTVVMVVGRGARETAASSVSTLPEHARPPEPDPAPNPRRHRREHAQRSRRTRAMRGDDTTRAAPWTTTVPIRHESG